MGTVGEAAGQKWLLGGAARLSGSQAPGSYHTGHPSPTPSNSVLPPSAPTIMNLLDSDGDERSEKFDLNFVLETQKKSQQLIDSTAEFEAEMRDLAEKRKKKAADEAKVKSSLQAVIVSLQLELNSVKEQNTILRAQVASLKETQLVDRTVSKDKAVSATTDPGTSGPLSDPAHEAEDKLTEKKKRPNQLAKAQSMLSLRSFASPTQASKEKSISRAAYNVISGKKTVPSARQLNEIFNNPPKETLKPRNPGPQRGGTLGQKFKMFGKTTKNNEDNAREAPAA
ncbi:hypothetical protein BKA81DRAFT_427023 [Phyllosticta paracitricarpa]|uniref:Uncharacterized protein n=1 Tax=Phyllosticta paracitricarpa TaxID=2016321 RepID=A0ABR1N8A3_9PEZI